MTRNSSNSRLTSFKYFYIIYYTKHKVPLRSEIDLISLGRRESKRGKTGVPMVCVSYFFLLAACCMLCVPGMLRFDDVRLIGASGVNMLSWFDLLVCATTTHTYIHRDYWHRWKSLNHGFLLAREYMLRDTHSLRVADTGSPSGLAFTGLFGPTRSFHFLLLSFFTDFLALLAPCFQPFGPTTSFYIFCCLHAKMSRFYLPQT